jgi:hypothetical protein
MSQPQPRENIIVRAIRDGTSYMDLLGECQLNWNQVLPNMKQMKHAFDEFKKWELSQKDEDIPKMVMLYESFGFVFTKVGKNHEICGWLRKDAHEYLGSHPELSDENKAILRKLRKDAKVMEEACVVAINELLPFVQILEGSVKSSEKISKALEEKKKAEQAQKKVEEPDVIVSNEKVEIERPPIEEVEEIDLRDVPLKYELTVENCFPNLVGKDPNEIFEAELARHRTEYSTDNTTKALKTDQGENVIPTRFLVIKETEYPYQVESPIRRRTGPIEYVPLSPSKKQDINRDEGLQEELDAIDSQCDK